MNHEAIELGRALHARGVPLGKVTGGWARVGWQRGASATTPRRKALRIAGRAALWAVTILTAGMALVVFAALGAIAGALLARGHK